MAKTNPSSVRFEESDFTFICRREGLKTPQQVVYFLMKEYMKMFKIEKPSIFASASTESFDGKKFNSLTHDEPAQWQEPKGNYFAPEPIAPIVTQYESWIIEINESRTNEELEKTMLFVKNDKSLYPKQRLYLDALAKKVFADKGFYKE